MIRMLANGDSVAINLHLKQGLHIDARKTKGAIFYNVNVDGGDYGIKHD